MAKRANDFWRVGLIVELFVQAGCDLRVAEPTVKLEDGDCLNVRYLVHEPTRVFVPLVDLEDDQWVSEDEVAFWERRLGLTIPRPSLH